MTLISSSIDNLINEVGDTFHTTPTKMLINSVTSDQQFLESPTEESTNESDEQKVSSEQESALVDKPKVDNFDIDADDENDSDKDLDFQRTMLQSHLISINRPQSKQSLFAEYGVATTTGATIENKSFGFPDSSLFRENSDLIESKTSDIKVDMVDVLDSSLANMAVTSIIHDEIESIPVAQPIVDDVHMEISTPKLNPVVESLQKEPKMKAFNLISPSKSNFVENSIIVNASTKDDSWISHDYNTLFGNRSFTKEINLSKLLRFEDKVPNLIDEEIIYISTRIINPGKIFSGFFKDGKSRNVYIDLILNHNGFTIFLQILKFFIDNEKEANMKIKDIFIRISASSVDQLKFVIEKFSELKTFYEKVKIFGLFSDLHVYSDNNFPITKSNSDKLKLPSKLEKLYLSTGLNLTDFIQLPVTVKSFALYNVSSLNFSKFNLNKKLDCLHISSNEQIKLIGKQGNFPKVFLDLKEIKFDHSIVVNPKFDKFSNLVNLSIRNLDFATTRQLTFPSVLKKLEFTDCLISSHISSFPDSLKFLSIKSGKWNKKLNCNLTRIQKLSVVKVDVKDLYEKVQSAKNLNSLEIVDCEVLNLKLPSQLKSLKLLSVDLKEFDVQFPPGLESIVLDKNNISLTGNLVQFPQVKSLRLTNNGIYCRVNLNECSKLEEVNLYDNEGLLIVELPKLVRSLNVANTKVHEIIGDNLMKLNLNGCTKIFWDTFVIPPSVTHLTVQGCELNRFEYNTDHHNLKVLNIANNFIERVDLSKFYKLEELDLSNNQLKSLRGLPISLKSINSGNNTINIVDLKPLNKLEWLDLSNNCITDISRVVIPTSLLTLLMNNNNLNKFCNNEFQLPNKLCHLEVNGCKLIEFDQMLPSTMLSLCCSNNQLQVQSFKFTFTGNSRLKYIDLRENNFTSFNFNMIKEIELAEINLTGNMFDNIPEAPKHVLSVLFI